MKQATNPHTIWLALFAIGTTLDTLGLLLPAPTWLRFSLVALGISSLLVGIVIMGRLQQSE